MQSHSLQGDTTHHTRTCQLMAEAGIKLIRDELYWSNLEREKGKIIFPENYLQNVEITLAHGIEPLIILDYGNPNYDNGRAPYTDEGREAFARYCTAVVSKFKGKIKYFEIWNEPNIPGFWKPEPNPKDYFLLLKTVYQACKQANPNCVILAGATSGVDLKFFEEVFKLGGLQYMDVLSLHPYTGVSPEGNDLVGKLIAARKLTEKYRKSLRIWITEIGYPTHTGPNGFTEQTQSDYLVRTYFHSLASGYVDAVFWYWFGPDGPDETYSEDRFGIIRSDWSPKPAYIAYKTMYEQINNVQYLGSIDSTNPAVVGYRFQNGNNLLTVLWSVKGRIPIGIKTRAKEIQIIAADGTQQTLTPLQNVVTFTLTESPIYIHSGKDPIQVTTPLFKFGKSNYVFPPGSTKSVTLILDNKSIKPNQQFDGLCKLAINPLEIQLTKEIIPIRLEKIGSPIYRIQMITPRLPSKKTAILTAQVIIGGKLIGVVETEIQLTEPAILQCYPELDLVTGTKNVKIRLDNLMESPISGELHLSSLKDTIIFDRVIIPFSEISAKSGWTYLAEIKESNDAPDTLYSLEVSAYLTDGNTLRLNKTIAYLPCKKSKQNIVIDGNLEEWKDAIPIRLTRAEQITVGKENWFGKFDGSATVSLLWDDKNIYVSAIVLDDKRSNTIKPSSSVYHSDGLEIYFDTDLVSDYTTAKYNDDDFQFGFFDTPDGPIVWRWSPGDTQDTAAQIAIVERNDLGENAQATGYILEARIPLSELRLSPQPGMVIGFTVALDDDDTPNAVDPFKQDMQMIWAGSKNNWCDPTGFGQLFFIE
ncbi:MAG: cellulase family glycosylhydrolase [bacterium]|nr:cellulase family glycosylhydrolase [bacterium]